VASKRRKRIRSPAPEAGISAGRSVLSGEVSFPRQNGGWAEPAVYGGFFLFLFLAFSPALESKFVLPKAIVLAAGVFALGTLLIVNIWRGHVLAPPRWPLLLALALAAWWMASTPFALHLPTALNGEYNRYNGLWTHLCWLALFVASLSLPLDPTTVRRIAALLTAAIVPVAVIVLAESTRLSAFGLGELSTLGDRVAVSSLMNFAIPFVIIALVRVRQRVYQAGLGVLLALLLVAEFLAQGRGAWMGLIAAAVILAMGLIRSSAGWKSVAALLLAAIMLAGLAAKLNPAVAQRFATLRQISQDASLNQRFVLYRAALRAASEHPLAGIGFDNFRNSYPKYRSAEDRYYFKNIVPTMVHDGYLQMAVTNGVPALLLYLALVAGVLTRLLRALRREQDRDRRELLLGFVAALSAYLVQDLVGWLDMALTSTFWIMLGLALNFANHTTPRPGVPWIKPAIALCSGLMLLLSLYLFGDRYARVVADTHLYRAQALDVRTQWPQAEALVNKALKALPGDSRTEMVAGEIHAMRFVAAHEPLAYRRGRELFEASFEHNRFDRLRLFTIVALESLALETGTIQTASDFSRNAIDALMQTDGDNPRYHEIRAGFQAAQKQYPEALAAIREAQRLAPQERRFRLLELEYEAKSK